MTGPDGDQSNGLWEVVVVDPPTRLEVKDLFADDHGEPNHDMPTTTMVVRSRRVPAARPWPPSRDSRRSRRWSSSWQMGMEEGITAAVGQIEAVLADG